MTISENLREQIRQVSQNRCGYCQIHAQFVYAPMEIDHIQPKSRGGTDEAENLWLACPRCNNFKSDQITGVDPETQAITALYNPRLQKWSEHFAWSEIGTEITGQTGCGRATV